MNAQIHPTAVIDAHVSIGKETKVWHHAHIMSGASIGRKCILGKNVFIGKKVTIGDGVKIQNNVSVYEGLHIEDKVFIGPSVVFTNVLTPRAFIERKEEFLKTKVCLGVSIGANATILCGITIGKYAMIGAGAVITKGVPDYALFVGNPAKSIGWVSEGGERLAFNEEGVAHCPVGKEAYQLKEGKVTRI